VHSHNGRKAVAVSLIDPESPHEQSSQIPARPWQPNLRDISISLAILAIVFMLGSCMNNTPTVVHSFCGTCSGSCRQDLQNDGVIALGVGFVTCFLASFSGSSMAVRVARTAFLAIGGMWIVSWGFVLRWW
jgi:hypothetical protein